MNKESKYEYLKKYIDRDINIPGNFFGSVKASDIILSEKKIGFKFPNVLKEFWLEIGYGFFHETIDSRVTNVYSNRLIPPREVAAIILQEEDSPMLPDYLELLQQDDIPFFEVADSSSFIFMKKNEKAIYYMGAEKIADTLEEFIYKLYHESPAYYIWIGREDQDPYRVKA